MPSGSQEWCSEACSDICCYWSITVTGWGWGESATVFEENRSHGSDEHIGVRVRIWLYLLTRMTWLFNWFLWWLCSSGLKKTSCFILQHSYVYIITLYLQCRGTAVLGFTVLLLCLHSPSLWKILNYSRKAQIRIKKWHKNFIFQWSVICISTASCSKLNRTLSSPCAPWAKVPASHLQGAML